jgi:hypothetical protein
MKAGVKRKPAGQLSPPVKRLKSNDATIVHVDKVQPTFSMGNRGSIIKNLQEGKLVNGSVPTLASTKPKPKPTANAKTILSRKIPPKPQEKKGFNKINTATHHKATPETKHRKHRSSSGHLANRTHSRKTGTERVHHIHHHRAANKTVNLVEVDESKSVPTRTGPLPPIVISDAPPPKKTAEVPEEEAKSDDEFFFFLGDNPWTDDEGKDESQASLGVDKEVELSQKPYGLSVEDLSFFSTSGLEYDVLVDDDSVFSQSAIWESVLSQSKRIDEGVFSPRKANHSHPNQKKTSNPDRPTVNDSRPPTGDQLPPSLFSQPDFEEAMSRTSRPPAEEQLAPSLFSQACEKFGTGILGEDGGGIHIPGDEATDVSFFGGDTGVIDAFLGAEVDEPSIFECEFLSVLLFLNCFVMCFDFII